MMKNKINDVKNKLLDPIIVSQKEKIKLNNYLQEGLIVALPTETVYGLAVKYDHIKAIERLNDLKERGSSPFTLMIDDKDDIDKYCVVSKRARRIINALFPGELTIILPKNNKFNNCYFDKMETIGIRIPNYHFMLDLLKASGPLLVTSANLKGEVPCLTSIEVIDQVPFVDIVVEGESGKSKPSTVISVNDDQIELLRAGSISIDYIKSI